MFNLTSNIQIIKLFFFSPCFKYQFIMFSDLFLLRPYMICLLISNKFITKLSDLSFDILSTKINENELTLSP